MVILQQICTGDIFLDKVRIIAVWSVCNQCRILSVITTSLRTDSVVSSHGHNPRTILLVFKPRGALTLGSPMLWLHSRSCVDYIHFARQSSLLYQQNHLEQINIRARKGGGCQVVSTCWVVHVSNIEITSDIFTSLGRYEILTPGAIPKGFMDGKKAAQKMVWS